MKLLFFAAVKCPAILVPPNVEMAGYGCQESSPEFGTTCFFNHQPGYKRINGSRSIVCNANQQWSGSPLQCEGQKNEYYREAIEIRIYVMTDRN